MSVPRAYDNVNFEKLEFLQKGVSLLRELGGMRIYYALTTLPKTLTTEEKEVYKAIASKSAMNKTIINETKSIHDAIKQINEMPKPQIPILLFSSNGSGAGVYDWKNIQKDYLANLKNSKLINLNTGHYVHYDEYESISDEIEKFISELDNTKKMR